MLVSYAGLPIVLLLINGVLSVHLHRIKRVPQDVQEDKQPYPLNHPPSVETYIPVTVIYDDEDDIPVLSRSVKQNETENKSSQVSSNQETVSDVPQRPIQPKALFANHPPTVEDYNPIIEAVIAEDSRKQSPLTSITKTEGDINKHDTISTDMDKKTDDKNNLNTTESVLKPKGRSLDFENATTNPKKTVRNHTKTRRLQKVIKVAVDEGDDKSQITVDKLEHKEAIPIKVDETYVNKDQVAKNTQFQRRTQPRDPVVPIIDSENYVFAYNGDYHYSYEGGDGTKAFERGELKTVDDGSSGTGVVGGFSYKDEDGNDFSLSYTADENGYRPVGAHLPTPPPIPIAIQRALALLATKTTPESITESNKYF